MKADLARSRTPRQIAGRLRLEANDASVETITKSTDAEGRAVSHEALLSVDLRPAQGRAGEVRDPAPAQTHEAQSVTPLGERAGGRIVGMVSIDDRPEEASDRRVPGAWEGDPVVGKSAIAPLVETNSRFLIPLGLPEGKKAAGLADVRINRANDLPALMRGSLAWDQGTEMARHAQLTVATDHGCASLTPTHRGNDHPMRTRTGSSGSTCPKASS